VSGKTYCNKCSGSGKYITFAKGTNTTAGFTASKGSIGFDVGVAIVDCAKCKGSGFINEDDKFLVPMKYIKNEYWNLIQ
jgi:DnaJ-class molecular chaperone